MAAVQSRKHAHTHTHTHLEDLKSSDVEDGTEGAPGTQRGVQTLVDTLDHPFEHPLIKGLGQCLAGELHLSNRERKRRGWERMSTSNEELVQESLYL